MLKFVLCIAASGMAAVEANAQAFPKFHVSAVDSNDAASASCQLSNQSGVAAIEAALRYNNVALGTDDDAVRGDAGRILFQQAVIQMSSGSCVVTFNMELGAFQYATFRVTGDSRFGFLELCSRGAVLTGPATGLQKRVNDYLADHLNQCLSEYTTSKDAG